MASCSFPTKCTSCSKEVQEEAAAFAIWKCRQDHHHVCCTVECQRALERRSEKVVDALNKMEHKVSNEGRMNALRRLPPQEREKLKQRDQAQQHDAWRLCPFDLKVADKCVPHCAHCMSRVGGKGVQGEDEVAPPPPLRPGDEGSQRAASSTAPPPPSELITDDTLLVPLSREEDDEDEVQNKKKGKTKKVKAPKLTIPIVPEMYTPDPSVEAEVGLGAWAKLEADAKAAAHARRTPPSDKTSKINQVVKLTGCSRDDAEELLEGSCWVVERAVRFHLDSVDSQPPVGAGAARSEVVWGAQRAAAQAAEPDTGSSPAEPRPGVDPPAPPMGMAPGWQAVFSQEHQQFYFWHTGTGKTTWTLPVYTEEQRAAEEAQRRLAEQEKAEQARRAEEERRREMIERAQAEERRKEEARREEARRAEERRRAEEAQKLASLNKIRDVTGLEEECCRAILEEAKWVHEEALHRAIAEQNRREAERKRREEQARELAERQRLEREKQERDRQEAERQQRELERQRQLLEEQRRRLELEREQQRQQALQQTDGSLGPDGPPWVRLCTRHFTPKSSAQGAIPLLHGQRVEVTWVDTQPDPEDSWAYGRLVDEPSKAGYFPKAVLREVGHDPRHRARGQECRVVERFSAPEDVGGYLSVEVGEKVQIFEMGAADVWAYVWRGADEKGWVPECVLRDL